jgi:hypothetical protein
LEAEKKSLENELALESVYSNPQLAKTKNAEYDVTKKKLDDIFHEWTELCEELESIEKLYEN